MDLSKARILDIFEQFYFMNHMFCVFVKIALGRRFLQISKTCFPKENCGTVNENIHNRLIFVQTELTF